MSNRRSEWKSTGAPFGAALVLLLAACGTAGFEPEDTIGALGGALTAEKCSAAAVRGKVTLCHATSSAKNPYVLVTVSENACRNGHANHEGDFISLDGTCPAVDPCQDVTCAEGDACFTAGVCNPSTGACESTLRPDAAPICTGECESVDGAWVLSDGNEEWVVTLSGDTCDFEMTCPELVELSGSGDGRDLVVDFLMNGEYPVQCPGSVDGSGIHFLCSFDVDGSVLELSYAMERSDDGNAKCTAPGVEDPEDPDAGGGDGEPGDEPPGDQQPGDGGSEDDGSEDDGKSPGDGFGACPCFDVKLLQETWEMWNDLAAESDWNLVWEAPTDAEWAILYWSVGTSVPYRETWVGGFTVQEDFCSAGRYEPDVVEFMVNETITPDESAACLDVFQDFLAERDG